MSEDEVRVASNVGEARAELAKASATRTSGAKEGNICFSVMSGVLGGRMSDGCYVAEAMVAKTRRKGGG